MSFLVAILFFLLPFAVFALWRRRNLNGEPSTALLILVGAAVAASVGFAAWYGLSRRQEPGHYVAPHVQDGRIIPGHTEPGR